MRSRALLLEVKGENDGGGLKTRRRSRLKIEESQESDACERKKGILAMVLEESMSSYTLLT